MRVVAIADSDSYVKWAAALLARMPTHWETELLVVRTTKEPSAGQLAAALAGSGRAPSSVVAYALDELVVEVAERRPDAVVIATIGPLADIVSEAVLDAAHARPVLVSGVPGIALPARSKALVYRSQVDLVVLHSAREVRVFRSLAAEHGFDHDFGLARLPFLPEPGRAGVGGTDVIFAAQAIVPRYRAERVRLLGWLVQLAERSPERRVVIKVRALAGEAQTHPEKDGYERLLAEEFPAAPANLVVEGGPMLEHLDRAGALVTVSSTAALEAAALGIPVLAIDAFGVTPGLLNEVFLGSGLLGSVDDLVEGRFPRASPDWLADNYLHAESESDWVTRLEALVAENRAGALPARPRHVRGPGGTLRRAWDRRKALGRLDTNPLGTIAVMIGTPARNLQLAWRELRTLVADEEDTRNTGERAPVAWDGAAADLRDPQPEPRRPR